MPFSEVCVSSIVGVCREKYLKFSAVCVFMIAGFQNQRVKVFQAIMKAIKDNEGIEKKRAVAMVEVSFGFSKKKAEEYIETLIEAGYVRETDGKLFYVGEGL